MQNPLAVDVVGPGSNLEEVVFDLWHGEELPHLGDMEQGLLRGQLQDQVDKVEVLEEMIELDDVGVGHHPVDPDLPLHLLPGPGSPPLLGVENLLVDDFISEVQPTGSLCDGVNLGKASLSEKLSSLLTTLKLFTPNFSWPSASFGGQLWANLGMLSS